MYAAVRILLKNHTINVPCMYMAQSMRAHQCTYALEDGLYTVKVRSLVKTCVFLHCPGCKGISVLVWVLKPMFSFGSQINIIKKRKLVFI